MKHSCKDARASAIMFSKGSNPLTPSGDLVIMSIKEANNNYEIHFARKNEDTSCILYYVKHYNGNKYNNIDVTIQSHCPSARLVKVYSSGVLVFFSFSFS